MARIPVQAFLFVLIVVRRGDRFLLVQEATTDRGTWFLPAGGVLPGEGLVEAAIRETREEAGVDVKPVALLWMEDETHLYQPGDLWAGRWRFILRAEMVDESQQPGPTDDSLDAGWFTLEEIAALPLRSPEVIWVCNAVAKGHPELPLDGGYLRVERR